MAEFSKDAEAGTFAMVLYATPVTETLTDAWMVIRLDYSVAGMTDEDFRRFQDVLAEQDRLIVESQQPPLLPLRGELHVRADRLAVHYRQWLEDRRIQYGVLPDPGRTRV
jgi:phenylpropionate dioxygenase-like ring-hydroxylating dioxygenase large terminal subunit